MWLLRLVAVAVVVKASLESWLVLPGQCQEDQSQQPVYYPLPTNFSIKPSSSPWHLSFTLRDRDLSSVSCIRFEEAHTWTEVKLFKGECSAIKEHTRYSYKTLQYHVKSNFWTTFDINMEDNKLHIIVKEPQGENITLKQDYLTPPQEGLEITVTDTHDVEAVVGCAVECQGQYYASREPGMMIKVGEGQQNPLHFYYCSESPDNRLLYEFICTESEGTELKNYKEIKGIAENLYFVEIKQNKTIVSVHRNGVSLKPITVPKSCNSSRHVIWVAGDGYFYCTRYSESPTTLQDTETTTQQNTATPLTSQHKGIFPILLLPIVVLCFFCLF